ncbi:ABC transporter permease [Lactococcus lactis]|uniref:ABC transporter permease n=1 Tax=Lactococcus lactis TaxID=1358 RepID=UPI00223BCA35|nr:ABC transporter permease [Lactococcus lactis]MCT1172111.1 ABC transporter permease [Lactococcus lactis]MDV4191914.1 ABC transporter permease [Lactococcus lactis subsp. lactis]
MDFIRRAWLFTKAKIGRTILLIVAFSAILIFVLSGLIINSAANVSIDNAKKSAGATVSLSVNMQNVIKEAQNSATSSSSSSSSDTAEAGKRFNIDLPTISETTAEKIAKLDGVKSASFTYQAQASASSGIEKVSTSSSSSSSSTDTQAAGGFGGREGGMGGASQEDFTISGTNDLAASTSFTDSYKISSGRAIKDSDEGTNNVVIESTLASQNSLKVGSTFTIKDSNDKTYKMTVVGIYTTTSSSTESSIQYMNTMYTALSVANSIKGTTGKVSNATYSMENPAQADTFVKAANKLVNDSNFQVSKNDQAYQNLKSSLNNVASFARNIVLIVAIAGAIILALIVMLMVRERRFEIGVLMSLGESKLKIIGQFFFELFMVMIVSVGIASAAGNVVGNVVGQQLLKQETTQTTTSTSNMQGAPGANGGKTEGQRPSGNAGGFMRRTGGAFGFGQSASEAKALEKLNIKTSVSEILLLVAIAILITLIAVGLASIGILRLNPKQVLTN